VGCGKGFCGPRKPVGRLNNKARVMTFIVFLQSLL
jgi:hypothetical protein